MEAFEADFRRVLFRVPKPHTSLLFVRSLFRGDAPKKKSLSNLTCDLILLYIITLLSDAFERVARIAQ